MAALYFLASTSRRARVGSSCGVSGTLISSEWRLTLADILSPDKLELWPCQEVSSRGQRQYLRTRMSSSALFLIQVVSSLQSILMLTQDHFDHSLSSPRLRECWKAEIDDRSADRHFGTTRSRRRARCLTPAPVDLRGDSFLLEPLQGSHSTSQSPSDRKKRSPYRPSSKNRHMQQSTLGCWEEVGTS